MDISGLIEKYTPFLKRNVIPLLLGFLGLICFGYGLMELIPHKEEKQDILFESASDQSTIVKNDVSPVKQATITIDIEGAVLKPGVYSLPEESRVQDALIASGGLAKNADHQKLAKQLNLASKVTDGGKIYIPFEGEDVLASSGQTVLGYAAASMININAASISELDTLSGIGKVTADKIIANRPYGTVDELVSKKIVGKKVFEQIKNKISVN
jgi:competence protein ComEA